MLKIALTSRFKKDLKKYAHNKPVKKELEVVLRFLLKEEKLPEKYLDHALTGSYFSFRECHVKPDTLLIIGLIYSTDFKLRIYNMKFFRQKTL